MPSEALPHICVCICTFRRSQQLVTLLAKLGEQHTENRFTLSAVVADNDAARSAEAAVTAFASNSGLSIKYCVEPLQNIALARNQALRHAEGDFIAFIDDDEIPTDLWLSLLLTTLNKFGVDGALGPVIPRYETEPPQWIVEGRFFHRPEYPTGTKVASYQGRTGNVLFKRSILEGEESPFDPRFDTAGEDVDFFRRMIAKGHVFIWCREGEVLETVPASRCSSRYLLRRALLRGSNFHKHDARKVRNFVTSALAVPAYAIALPFLALLGKHQFMKYLIKICDHGSRLLAYLGIHLVTQRET
jgi:succinoglycan biosynthesis protein ExoM